ncbi:MAG: hypothetical protein LBM27_02570 [Lactobacillaceae bacterium]|jgi:hypothetical protein|nr:hypothetical protein [Lactobacillaceae bacterium]
MNKFSKLLTVALTVSSVSSISLVAAAKTDSVVVFNNQPLTFKGNNGAELTFTGFQIDQDVFPNDSMASGTAKNNRYLILSGTTNVNEWTRIGFRAFSGGDDSMRVNDTKYDSNRTTITNKYQNSIFSGDINKKAGVFNQIYSVNPNSDIYLHVTEPQKKYGEYKTTTIQLKKIQSSDGFFEDDK